MKLLMACTKKGGHQHKPTMIYKNSDPRKKHQKVEKKDVTADTHFPWKGYAGRPNKMT
jgi:hypothetical protein